jgi:hypothetical protein
MGSLADILKVDGTDYPLAEYFNIFFATALRAEFTNTETITATKQLTDDDYQIQIITASGANRDVELAPEATTNHITILCNGGASNNVVVKDDSAAVTYATLRPDEWVMCIPLNAEGWKVVKGSALTEAQTNTTIVEGMKLIWNSATSISVGVGSCYAENGDNIDATSAIVKSSLSLSVSTFYHVYVYLSSGVPAAEVVTTAPVAWKGTAYSKTGDTSRRYVGSILTDASGNVKSFYHDPIACLITYKKFQSSAAPHRVLSAGTATTATAVACSGIIPATSALPLLRILNNSDQIARTSDDNGVSSSQVTVVLGAGNVAAQIAFTPHPVDASLQLWYAMAAAVGSGNLTIDVLGYFYER